MIALSMLPAPRRGQGFVPERTGIPVSRAVNSAPAPAASADLWLLQFILPRCEPFITFLSKVPGSPQPPGRTGRVLISQQGSHPALPAPCQLSSAQIYPSRSKSPHAALQLLPGVAGKADTFPGRCWYTAEGAPSSGGTHAPRDPGTNWVMSARPRAPPPHLSSALAPSSSLLCSIPATIRGSVTCNYHEARTQTSCLHDSPLSKTALEGV